MSTDRIQKIIDKTQSEIDKNERRFAALFSRKLRYYLSINNMTQKDLADKLGTSTTSVYNWVSGIKTPRMDKIDAMCEIFGCRRSDFLSDDFVPPRQDVLALSDEEQRIIRAYRNLSEVEKDMVCRQLQVRREKDSSLIRIEESEVE